MTEVEETRPGVIKHPTGISGFDFVSQGGIPRGRSTLVAGSSGTGKTILSAQFLVEGIRQWGEAGIFVTFEEPRGAIRTNFESLQWHISKWEESKMWAFVDVSSREDYPRISGDYDLGALIPRIEQAVESIGAERLVIDSLDSLSSQFANSNMVRPALERLMDALRRLGITTLITAERTEEYGRFARFGVEEFVVDSTILLRNRLDKAVRRRTIEILKMRGTSHAKGEFPYTISVDAAGVSVIPLSAVDFSHPPGTERVSFGVPELDQMCAGGLFAQSVALVAGPTGTGKTLIGSHFLASDSTGRSLLFAFEEGRGQILRNAAGWNLPFDELEREDALRIIATYPETATLEDHLVRMKLEIGELRPDRVVVDSLSALSRIGSMQTFREFLISLVAHMRQLGITVLFTANTSDLEGGGIVSETQVSSMTDTIILLRYAEKNAQIHRGITVLKMRGSDQDKTVRSFAITSNGMKIGEAFDGEDDSLLGLPSLG